MRVRLIRRDSISPASRTAVRTNSAARRLSRFSTGRFKSLARSPRRKGFRRDLRSSLGLFLWSL